jgi:hypothetical protein
MRRLGAASRLTATIAASLARVSQASGRVPARQTSNVYVDGFNLYYGCLRHTAYKWLDLEALCKRLLPAYDIRRIRYFTARVSGRTDPGTPLRSFEPASSAERGAQAVEPRVRQAHPRWAAVGQPVPVADGGLTRNV